MRFYLWIDHLHLTLTHYQVEEGEHEHLNYYLERNSDIQKLNITNEMLIPEILPAFQNLQCLNELYLTFVKNSDFIDGKFDCLELLQITNRN